MNPFFNTGSNLFYSIGNTVSYKTLLSIWVLSNPVLFYSPEIKKLYINDKKTIPVNCNHWFCGNLHSLLTGRVYENLHIDRRPVISPLCAVRMELTKEAAQTGKIWLIKKEVF